MSLNKSVKNKRDNNAPHYIHVQPDVNSYTVASEAALSNMEGSIRQLASDPKLFLTKELGTKIQALADQTALLKMDNCLMQVAPKAWREQFPMRQFVTEKQGLLRTAEKLEDSGGQLVRRFITNMTRGRIGCASDRCAQDELSAASSNRQGVGWTDSAVSSAHAWANQELVGLHDELAPLTAAAQQRTSQYLDDLGVTNRYIGYRTNLGYLSNLGQSRNRSVDNGVKNKLRPDEASRWEMPIVWNRAQQVGTRNYNIEQEDYNSTAQSNAWQNKPSLDATEDTGELYPGKSEYQTAYIQPFLHDATTVRNPPPATHRHRIEQPKEVRGRGNLAEFDSSMVHSKGYPINPTPNFLASMRESTGQNKSSLMFNMANAKSEMKDSYSWSELSNLNKIKNNGIMSVHS